MRDAIDKVRGLVAWTLTLILVLAAVRVFLNFALIERGLETGFANSAVRATAYEELVIAGLVGLALALTLTLGGSGPLGIARVLLIVSAAALALLACLALIAAIAVFLADLTALQQLLGFVTRLSVIALLAAVAFGSWSLSRSGELVHARPSTSAHGYPQHGEPQGTPWSPRAEHPPPYPFGAQQQYSTTSPYGPGAYGPPVPREPEPHRYRQVPPSGAGGSYPAQPGPQHGSGGSATPYVPHTFAPQAGAGVPQYGQPYAEQYSQRWGHQYGEPSAPEPTYTAPYAQQYAPRQYEQQHGSDGAGGEGSDGGPYPEQRVSEQGRPLDTHGSTAVPEGGGDESN